MGGTLKLLRLIPRRGLSRLTGRITRVELPEPAKGLLFNWFIRKYGIDVDEMEGVPRDYRTLSDLFSRRLKPGRRPMAEGATWVHPCDAKVVGAGQLQSGQLLQAKGNAYSIDDLLPSSLDRSRFVGGQWITYYLCPTDYHRVHVPASGDLAECDHRAGDLWPVNDPAVQGIRRLYSTNERVGFAVNTPQGNYALIMVGALNVGNIQTRVWPELKTNLLRGVKRPSNRLFAPKLSLKVGEELALFAFGSTVVLLLEAPLCRRQLPEVGSRVKVGQTLA